MSIKTKEIMTVPELQEWIGLGRSKTYELLRTGEIKSYRIGRLLRIRHQDVEAWLEQNRYRPVANDDERRRTS